MPFDKIDIRVIPHNDQRYNTVGDYWQDQDGYHFRISDLGNWKYHVLIAIHELTEYVLCFDRNISEESVTAFDEQFETEDHPADAEPGNDLRAPYREEHRIASVIERTLGFFLDVDWEAYDKSVVDAVLSYKK